jgi:hypothetical protein
VSDLNADGNPYISAGGLTNNRFYSHPWLGDGVDTLAGRDPHKSNPNPKWSVEA